MNSVTVITLADEGYAMPLAVMVRSLLDHLGAGRTVRVVVVDGGIAPATKQRLRDSWQGSEGWNRCQVEYVAPCYGGARYLPVWGRVTVLTYARLSVDAYVPRGCDQAVLLDSDTLVLTDIGRLAETDLEGATVAAAQDSYIPLVSSVGGIPTYAALGLKRSDKYFNAGVLLIDLERWRADRVGPGAFAFIQRHWRTLQQYDQDSLNVALAGRWKELDPRWQVSPRTAHSLGHAPLDEPWILHFSGRLKPWDYPGRERADVLFHQFVDRTTWRGTRPRRTLRSWVLRAYDSPARRLVYPIEKRLLTFGRHLVPRRVQLAA